MSLLLHDKFLRCDIMKMKIHQEGQNILIILCIILLILNSLIHYFINIHYVSIPFLVISIIFFLLVLNFFRSPKRHYKGDIEKVMENEYFHDKRIQVSIFMSIFNVHANWFPVNGTVTHVSHQNGRFMAAYLPKSSTENERSTVVIKTDKGEEILMRQIAGAMARRIVTYAEVGDKCHINEHMGFIKFGSRVDVFLPLGTEVLVKLNDKTTGNITQIARL